MIAKTRKEALAQGQKRYYTGAPCPHGHIADRRASTGECLECRAVNLVAWRKTHPEKVKQHNDTQYANHSVALAARSRKFYAENAEVLRIKKQEYQRKNLHIYAKLGAKRRAAKLQRTPVWLTADDHWMIEQAYELAALRTKMLGFPWEVDHIIPLQGSKVSGLHVPQNLQVIPRKQNRAKWNLYEPQVT
jgi:hypothetical protein